ncbi:hypothetical protein, partial [Nitrospirillum viridazoti]|uniref:hypothetical protein n=1 Tax=Nitrospirillum viridazoti TaxID=3144925 RepID=UPI001B3C128F
ELQINGASYESQIATDPKAPSCQDPLQAIAVGMPLGDCGQVRFSSNSRLDHHFVKGWARA